MCDTEHPGFVIRHIHIRKLYEFVCTLLYCCMYFEAHDDVEWMDSDQMLGLHHTFVCTLHLPPMQQPGMIHGRVFLSEWYRLLTPIIDESKFDERSFLDRHFFIGAVSNENNDLFALYEQSLPDLVFLPIYSLGTTAESPALYPSVSIADPVYQYKSPIFTLVSEQKRTCALPRKVHCTQRVDFLKITADTDEQTAEVVPIEDLVADFKERTITCQNTEIPWMACSPEEKDPVGFVNRTTWNRVCNILKSDLFYTRGHTYTRENAFFVYVPKTHDQAISQGLRLYSIRGCMRVPYLWKTFVKTKPSEALSKVMEGLSFLDDSGTSCSTSTPMRIQTVEDIPRALRPMQNYDIFSIRNECILVWNETFVSSSEFDTVLGQLEQMLRFGALRCILTGGCDLYVPIDAIGVTFWKYFGHAFDRSLCTEFVEARVWVFDLRLVCTQMRSQVGFIGGVTLVDEHLSSQVVSTLPPSNCYAKPISRQILTTTPSEEHFIHVLYGTEYRRRILDGDLQVWIANNLVYIYHVADNVAVILTNGRVHLNGMSPRMLSPREQLLRLGPQERGWFLDMHRMEAWYPFPPATQQSPRKTEDEQHDPMMDEHSMEFLKDDSEGG